MTGPVGGFYVFAVERGETANPAYKDRDYVTLIAGPFATYAEADAAGPKSVKLINEKYSKADKLHYGICEFYALLEIEGVRNKDLWIKPKYIAR